MVSSSDQLGMQRLMQRRGILGRQRIKPDQQAPRLRREAPQEEIEGRVLPQVIPSGGTGWPKRCVLKKAEEITDFTAAAEDASPRAMTEARCSC